MIHLDTSFVIDLMRERARGRGGPATRRVESLADEVVALSVFVLCELEIGSGGAADPAGERRRVRAICDPMTIIYPDERFPAVVGSVYGRLPKSDRTIGTMDLLIGATAVADSAPLVTRNRSHFSRIAGLRILDY